MDVDEDAVQQLVDLGISWKQAVIALQKYNNDVMRAADYIFSGHADQDALDPLELPEAAPPPLPADSVEVTHVTEGVVSVDERESSPIFEKELPDGNPVASLDTGSPNGKASEAADQPEVLDEVPVTDAAARQEDESYSWRDLPPVEAAQPITTGPTYPMNYDVHQWSVVPYKDEKPTLSSANSGNDEDYYTHYNLTWWRDPGAIHRTRINSLPVGLRPPPYDFSCSPPLLQALYHIPLFRTAILSHRPIPSDWGSYKNYWRGAGRSIPDEQKPVVTSQPPAYQSIDDEVVAEMEHMKISPNESEDTPNVYDSDEYDESEEMLQEEQGYLAAKSAANVKVIYEIQRLFAFLYYSNRRYVSVTNVVRAAQASGNIAGTELTNARPEGFLEQLITCAGFTNSCENSFKLADGTSYRCSSLFSISAIIEVITDWQIQDDVDQETAFFLVISPDENQFDFHGCLRPLIYEYNNDSDSESEFMDEQLQVTRERPKTCKITSFTEVPPILHIFLEDPNQYSIGVHTTAGGRHNSYKIEKTIYMDRYLHRNRDKVIQINEDITNAKAKVTRAKDKLNYYNRNCRERTAAEYLQHTVSYFKSKPADESTEMVEHILNKVKCDIDNGNKELEEAEHDLHRLSEAMFKCDGLFQCKYVLHAILMHDGGNGTGHHWAYINTETSSIDPQEDKTWVKCCDASVVFCTEEEVFNDEALVYSLIYVNAEVVTLDIPVVDDIIPQSLKEHVMGDCAAFEEELEGINDIDESTETEIQASEDEDDDATAEFPAVPSPDMTESGSDMERSDWVEETLLKIHQEESGMPGDHYRVVESFEIFLAKFGETNALRYLLEIYGSAFDSSSPPDPEAIVEAVQNDSRLEWQYQLYLDYVAIADKICKAVEAIDHQQEELALKHLVTTKEQAAKWKESLWRRSNRNNIETLFEGQSYFLTIQQLGKHVLTASNNKAYARASNAAYRKRGFEDAIRISKYAQALLDPESLEHDPFYNQLQEQWLSFTDTLTGSLDDTEAELFNTLVMSFLEYQGLDTRDLEITGQEPGTMEEDINLRTWERYQAAMEKVDQILASSHPQRYSPPLLSSLSYNYSHT